MKRKISFLVSALCAICACASLTACMTESQNSKDENIEKARSNTKVVEQQNGDNSECPDGNCPEEKPEKQPKTRTEAPDIGEMPPMPEFRFAPPPEHMPAPANIAKSGDSEDSDNAENNAENGDGEEPDNDKTPENGKKPPMPAPHKGGKIKPKMPKKGK